MVFPLVDSAYCRRVRKFSYTRSNISLSRFMAIISDSIFAMSSSRIVSDQRKLGSLGTPTERNDKDLSSGMYCHTAN